MPKIHSDVGYICGTTPDGTEVVGLLFKKDDPIHEEDDHEFYMTLPAAKALLIDLNEAISYCLEHKG